MTVLDPATEEIVRELDNDRIGGTGSFRDTAYLDGASYMVGTNHAMFSIDVQTGAVQDTGLTLPTHAPALAADVHKHELYIAGSVGLAGSVWRYRVGVPVLESLASFGAFTDGGYVTVGYADP